MSPGRPAILGPLLVASRQEPTRPLFTFVDRKGADAGGMTTADLVASTSRIVGTLRAAGLSVGDRAVLLYPPSLDFVAAFAGCLAAGVVPVPVPVPDPRSAGRGIDGCNRVVADCGAAAVLTNGAGLRLRTLGSLVDTFRNRTAWADVPWHRVEVTGGPTPVPVAEWYTPDDIDRTALIQYTSGATSTPRGVMITHRNLIAEAAANRIDLGLGPDARAVSWAPHFHDMGLISVILSSIAGNGHSYLISPLSFLRDPGLWLDVVTRVRATHTCAPTFAYDLVIRRSTPERRRTWDLGSLRIALCSAEAIRPDTVERFRDTFAPQGFAAEAFFGAYGLAEHTVTVTMGGRRTVDVDTTALAAGRVVPRGTADPSTTRYFSSGRPTKPTARLLIVDPDTSTPCLPDRVGEIWIDSDTKAAGYYGREQESEDTFRARAVGATGTYLRTGDLGFLCQGELFVTGRIKEMIILRGRNLYPVDIEASVRRCHQSIRPGGIAAFAVQAPDGAEGIGLFVECRDRRLSVAKQDELVTAILGALSAHYQVTAQVIVLGRRGLVPKTTSGKIRRNACQRALRDATVTRSPHLVRVVRCAPRESEDSCGPREMS